MVKRIGWPSRGNEFGSHFPYEHSETSVTGKPCLDTRHAHGTQTCRQKLIHINETIIKQVKSAVI